MTYYNQSIKIETLKLGQDLYEAQKIIGYDKLYRVKATSMTELNPFRVWINFQDEWWPFLVRLDTYPLITRPTITLQGRIPPCPKHPKSWHPNIFDDGRVCWGEVSVFPEMRIGGLLNMLYGMVHNPNHRSPVPDRCGTFSMLEADIEGAVESVKGMFDRFVNTLENADDILKSGEWDDRNQRN